MLDEPLSLRSKLPPFTAAYLEHRVGKEPDDGNPALVCIRRVAARLTYDEESRRRYIVYLCALAVPNIKSVFIPNQPVHKAMGLGTFENHVQAAAVYMNHTSDIERWEAPMTSSSLFGSCFNLAARSESAEMIELYLRQQILPYRSRALVQAAERGQANMVRFLYNYRSETYPWSYADVRVNASMYPSGCDALLQALSTPSPEIWDFVMQLLRENDVDISRGRNTDLLIATQSGWTKMARHILQHGIWGSSLFVGHPIWHAAREGHLDIVRALLDYGAAVRSDTMRGAALNGHLEVVRLLLASNANMTGAVVDAAKGGHGDIVELLLKNGGRANDYDGELPAVAYAILAEHGRMLQCLLDHGARLPKGDLRDKSLKRAQQKGVDSMLSLLPHNGHDHTEHRLSATTRRVYNDPPRQYRWSVP